VGSPLHGIFVDRQNTVSLSGSAKEDNQIVKFTAKGQFLLQIGHSGKNRGSNDKGRLAVSIVVPAHI
jgi:hypothetical protein